MKGEKGRETREREGDIVKQPTQNEEKQRIKKER